MLRKMNAPENRYEFYHQDLHAFVAAHVVPGGRALEIGCGRGNLLDLLKPSFGVGLDISEEAVRVARGLHPHLRFVQADGSRLPVQGQFDYVIASNLVGYLPDVEAFLRETQNAMGPKSRLIITYYNFAWEPVLRLAEKLRLKDPEPLQNWLSTQDLVNLLELSDFETISSGYRTVIPVGPAKVMPVINRVLGLIPGIRQLGITSYVVARSTRRVAHPAKKETTSPRTCSVIIPTRNERGNIRSAIARMPELGSHTEIIFVDGNSTDGTADEIRQVIADSPDRDIKLIHQGDGIGKADAVRKGFAAAAGDVLMILDADLTVPPEDLPKFWNALISEKAEFVNGTRLVYPMEDQAMRVANIAGNKAFSLLFSWILNQRITDTLCGTKVLYSSDYKRIAENRHVFGDFDPFGDFELLFGAAHLGLKIKEVPIRYRERTYGQTNIDRWRHGLILLKMAWLGIRKLKLR